MLTMTHHAQLLQTRPNLLRQHDDLRIEVDGLRQMIEARRRLCAYSLYSGR